MSGLGLNKIVGAVLLATLALFVIGKVGDGLVGAGGRHHGPATAPVATAVPPPAAQPAAPPEPAVPLATLLAEGDVERGRRVFNKCKACHTTAEGGKNGVGPNLWNVVNATPGRHEGFKYSAALAGIGDRPWTYENLNAFLTRPRAYAKGTKMTFAGLKRARDRANVILFLRSLSAAPAPIE